MPRKPKTDLSETMKLRHYVMNTIHRDPGRSIRIPSSRELAAMFGVARSTVQLALEGLIAEGYLTSKPGVATFTVPRNNLQTLREEKSPLIGLALSSGDYFFYDQSAWEMLSSMGLAASDRNCNIRVLDHVTLTPENIGEVIENNYLDALFCGNVFDAEVVRRAAKKIPVVTLGTTPVSGVSSVEFDWRPAAKQFRELLIREDRRKLLLLNLLKGPLVELLEELDDGSIRLEHGSCLDLTEFAELREALKKNPPEALVCRSYSAEVSELLRELKLDPRNDCMLVAYINFPRRGYHGGGFRLPYGKACSLAADILHRRLFSDDERVRNELCQVELIPQL